MNLFSKSAKFTYIAVSFLTMFVSLFFLDGYRGIESEGDNYFHVFINGVKVGSVGDEETAEKLFVNARRKIALKNEELTFIDADMTLEGEEVLWGVLDDREDLQNRMQEILEQNVMETMQRSYTLKVNEYVVNLGSAGQVQELLQAAVDKYDTEKLSAVELARDSHR